MFRPRAETYGSGVFGAGSTRQHGAIPSCANKGLINDLAREQWHFDGYVTSDCEATAGVERDHNYTHTPMDTVVAVLGAGMDSDCGHFMTIELMQDAYQNASLAALADAALRRLFKVQMRLGTLFFFVTFRRVFYALYTISIVW